MNTMLPAVDQNTEEGRQNAAAQSFSLRYNGTADQKDNQEHRPGTVVCSCLLRPGTICVLLSNLRAKLTTNRIHPTDTRYATDARVYFRGDRTRSSGVDVRTDPEFPWKELDGTHVIIQSYGETRGKTWETQTHTDMTYTHQHLSSCRMKDTPVPCACGSLRQKGKLCSLERHAPGLHHQELCNLLPGVIHDELTSQGRMCK